MAFLSMESIWKIRFWDLVNYTMFFLSAKLRSSMEKKVFLKYLIALLLFGSNGVVAACGRFVFVGAVLFAGRSVYFSSKEKIFWIFGIVRQCWFLFCFWEKPCCHCKLSVLSWWLAAQWFVNLSKRNRLNKHKNPSRNLLRDGFFTAIIRWNWKCIGRIITAFVVLCARKHYRTRRRLAFVPFVRR